jgi:hypothetical protein
VDWLQPDAFEVLVYILWRLLDARDMEKDIIW